MKATQQIGSIVTKTVIGDKTIVTDSADSLEGVSEVIASHDPGFISMTFVKNRKGLFDIELVYNNE